MLGFDSVLLPTGQSCEDSWITATGLSVVTERLKYLVAQRPGVTLPPLRQDRRPRSTGWAIAGCY